MSELGDAQDYQKKMCSKTSFLVKEKASSFVALKEEEELSGGCGDKEELSQGYSALRLSAITVTIGNMAWVMWMWFNCCIHASKLMIRNSWLRLGVITKMLQISYKCKQKPILPLRYYSEVTLSEAQKTKEGVANLRFWTGQSISTTERYHEGVGENITTSGFCTNLWHNRNF